jgi:nitroreductase
VIDAAGYQAEHFDDTSAVIAACYTQPPTPTDPKGDHRGAPRGRPTLPQPLRQPRISALQNASRSYPGVQNLLLAVRALGLAANISTWHLLAEDNFKQVLGVPKQTTIYALVPIGWPAGQFGPVRRRPPAHVTHWDRW